MHIFVLTQESAVNSRIHHYHYKESLYRIHGFYMDVMDLLQLSNQFRNKKQLF